MSSSSWEALGFAVVLSVIAIAAVLSLVRRPRRPERHGPGDGPNR